MLESELRLGGKMARGTHLLAGPEPYYTTLIITVFIILLIFTITIMNIVLM